MLEHLPEALGEALQSVRAGLTATVFHSVDLKNGMGSLRVESLAFADHMPLPTRYTADAEDGMAVSPQLKWSGVPAAATEIVLIVEDADSPTPQPWVQALAHGLPPRRGLVAEDASRAGPAPLALDEYAMGAGELAEGALGGADGADPLVPMGRNSLLQTRWLPPDPPPGHGVHRYLFQLFALGPGTALPETPGRDALRQALLERGLASGCLIGTCERPSGTVTEPTSPSLRLATG